MKDELLKSLCVELNIYEEEIKTLIRVYSYDDVKNSLILLSTKNLEKPIGDSLSELKAQLKIISKKNCISKEINNIKEELSYPEYSKLIEKHGKDFIDFKIDYTEKLANKFEIQNIKELLLYLIDNDKDSNKYGINPLIKNEIKSMQKSVKEFNQTISSGLNSFKNNTEILTTKLINSYKETTDKNVETVKAVNNKYIHQSRNILYVTIQTPPETNAFCLLKSTC